MSAILDQSVRLILADDVVQSVFREIVRNRSALLKEIRHSLSEDRTVLAALGGDDQTKIGEEVDRAVQTLKDAALIKERTAPIEDFSTFYVTAEGLTAERKLKMVE